MATETYNEQHAHNYEIIDKKFSPVNGLIGKTLNGSNLDDVTSLVCIKFSIFCSIYTNHSIVADQQLV